MIIKKIKNNKGFTLIEVLVALAVLLIAVLGPMTTAFSGMKSAEISRDRITAFYLAEEGLELIRWTRDSKSLAQDGGEWFGDLSGKCTGAFGCYIDTYTKVITACETGGCPVMKYDNATGKYEYNAGSNSEFTRTIFVDEIQNNVEISVEVRVSWTVRGSSKTLVIRDRLFNWQ